MRRKRPVKTARNKMMDFLARRDHSEKELRDKLKRDFSAEEIEKAIQYGKDNHWLPNDAAGNEKLSLKTADVLHRKKKGAQYINQYLNKKGLPPVKSDPSLELEKAWSLVKNKYSEIEDLSLDEKKKAKAKLGRFLVARGFDLEIVRKVIYEKL